VDSETINFYKKFLDDTMKGLVTLENKISADYGKINNVFNHYEKYKTIIKEMIQENIIKKDEDLLEEDCMDHHKIAAALCCSVLKERPLEPLDKDNKNLKFREEFCNEICATWLGFQVIQNYWDKKRCGKDEVCHLKTPEPLDKESTYYDWFARIIRKETHKYLDYENKKYFERTMLLYLSHIFYLIDIYTAVFYKKI